jgi:serine/threonine protein kinase
MKSKILEGEYSLEGKVWDVISDGAKDLVKQLLTYDKDKRISACEALTHPWIEEM